MSYRSEFGRSRLNGTSVITAIRRKKLTARVPPFTVTQGHRNRHRSIGYLWLPISDPEQAWACLVAVTEISTLISDGNCKIFQTRTFNADAEGSMPWKFVTVVGLKKLQLVKMFDAMSFHLDTTSQCNWCTGGQTDRQTDRNCEIISRSACYRCWREMKRFGTRYLLRNLSKRIVIYVKCRHINHNSENGRHFIFYSYTVTSRNPLSLYGVVWHWCCFQFSVSVFPIVMLFPHSCGGTTQNWGCTLIFFRCFAPDFLPPTSSWCRRLWSQPPAGKLEEQIGSELVTKSG